MKNYNRTAVSRLPSLWREKFQSFSVDERDFLNMDNRLVIPNSTRAMIMCSLHYGHPGRDALLALIGDIWWPRIHREVIDQARLCEQCLQSGKNLKCFQSQKVFGKNSGSKRTKRGDCTRFRRTVPKCKRGEKVSVGVDRPFFGMAGRLISKVSHYEKSYRISEAIHSALWGA